LTSEKAKNKKGVQHWKVAQSKSGKNHDNIKFLHINIRSTNFQQQTVLNKYLTNKLKKPVHVKKFSPGQIIVVKNKTMNTTPQRCVTKNLNRNWKS
jgi:hypothetical protein